MTIAEGAESRTGIDIERLPQLPIAELRAVWARHMGRAAAPKQKRLLIRELAWRAQEQLHGGLDADTRRLLRAAVRAARVDAPATDFTTTGKGAGRRPRGAASTCTASAAQLCPATRLVRTWRGVAYEVLVLENGRFRYRNQTYGSLSQIARDITGARWSGPRFFGLTTRAAGDRPSDSRGRAQ